MKCGYMILAFVLVCIIAAPAFYTLWWHCTSAPYADMSVLFLTFGSTEIVFAVSVAAVWRGPGLLRKAKSEFGAIKAWMRGER